MIIKLTLKYKIFAGIVLLLAVFFMSKAKVNAETYNVGSITGSCGFIEVIDEINGDATPGDTCLPSSPGSNTIVIGPGTYILTGSIPAITGDGDITIQGSGVDSTIIDGSGFQGLVFQPPSANNTYTISDITFEGFTNSASFESVLLSYTGNVQINNIVARNNNCIVGGGVPICNILGNFAPSTLSTIQISNSSFYNNSAQSIFAFGNRVSALQPAGGSLSVNVFNNTFNNNSGANFLLVNGSDTETVEMFLTNNTFADMNLPSGNPLVGTFLVNQVGATFDTYAADVFLKNNIFDNNISDGQSNNCADSSFNGPNASIQSLGGNISSDLTCSAILNQQNDLNNIDPLLGAFVQEEGAMLRPISVASPAYNNGILSGAPANDQRGISRPQYGAIDSGAYELEEQLVTENVSFKVPNTGINRHWLLKVK